MSAPWTAYFTSADGIKGCEPTAVPDRQGRPPYDQVRVAARPTHFWLDVSERAESITDSRLLYRRYTIDKIDHGHRIVWYKEELT